MNEITLQKICAELETYLIGKKFGKIFPLSRFHLAIDFRLSDSQYLLISVEPSAPRLYLIKRRVRDLEKLAKNSSPFVLLLRMRFNAGLFDLIIGLFSSLILLSPFLLWGGNWWSFAGVSGFLATWAIIMFAYLTTAIGYYGKTFGMRLFSLEVIDIGGENYPTLHQAAASKTVLFM